MNTREEFEKYLKKNNPFYPSERRWTMADVLDAMDYVWDFQQKKIDELQLKLDIKDDAIAGYRLVIEKLQAGKK